MRTLVMIKPDCIKRRLVGTVISAIESQGLNILQLEQRKLTREEAADLYHEHKGKYYFERNLNHVTSSSVILLQAEGPDAVNRCRHLVETFRKANKGFVINPMNLLHATSDENKVDDELLAVGFVSQRFAEAI